MRQNSLTGQHDDRHIDERGAARMVDVSEKPDFEGCQSVRARDHEAVCTLRMISDGAAAKGDVMAAAG